MALIADRKEQEITLAKLEDDQWNSLWCRILAEKEGETLENTARFIICRHTWKEVEKVEPTCTEEGSINRVCEKCGCEETVTLEPKGHTEEIIPGEAPTCTKAGKTEGKKCSVCKEILVASKEIPAKGHTEEIIPGEAPTCTKAGKTEGKKCSVCGEILVPSEEIPATGHKWDDGKVTKAATTTSTGIKTYTCTVCGETRTEIIPKLPVTTLKKGAKFTDKKSNATYKVTGSSTVEYMKPKAAKATVKVPSAVTVNGMKYSVTSIAANAFKNNKKLKSIVIPSSVTKIGKNAFLKCKNLKKITIQSKKLTAKSVGKNAFKGIYAKAAVKVPKGKAKAYQKILRARGLGKKAKVK